MAFLDKDGLAIFYEKIKKIFISTIKTGGDELKAGEDGSVTITNVPYASNLSTPDAQGSYNNFIYRTSGGTTSLASGPAQLVYIDGNTEFYGKINEKVDIAVSSDSDITVNFNKEYWNINEYVSQQSAGSSFVYTFEYQYEIPSVSYASWEPTTHWVLNDAPGLASSSQFTNLELNNKFGIDIGNSVAAPSIEIVNETVYAISAYPSIWMEKVNKDGPYVFKYELEENIWTLNDDEDVELDDYGIDIINGPVATDIEFIVNYRKGTPNNSTITVSYTKPTLGTIINATPSTFISTGFNQFDKNTMYISDASFVDGSIAESSNSYICYCKAVGNVEKGYVAYSSNGNIQGLAWCSALPTIGIAIDTTNVEYASSISSIKFNNNGYVAVQVNSIDAMDDLCIHPRWSYSDDKYEIYASPSVIAFPTMGIIDDNTRPLPIGSYGMPRIGNIMDRLNLETGQYIKRIEQVPNSPAYMSLIESYDTDFIYDSEYIYYVLPSNEIITYNVTNIESEYIVNDFGTEEFTNTLVPVGANILYGQNLRDKLRSDVLTISQQELSDYQLTQVNNNLKTYSLERGNQLLSPIDLDNFLEVGVFYGYPAVARQIEGMPSGDVAFKLIVERLTQESYLQTVKTYNGFQWQRNYSDGSWGEWKKVLSGVVPVSLGGTGTTSLASARYAMGLGNSTGVLDVTNGGTGSSSTYDAAFKLGCRPWLKIGNGVNTTFTVSIKKDSPIRGWAYLHAYGSASGLCGKWLIYMTSSTTTKKTVVLTTEYKGSSLTLTPSTTQAQFKIRNSSTGANTYVYLECLSSVLPTSLVITSSTK